MIAEKEPAGATTGVAALLRETRIKLGRDIAVAATTLRIRQPYLEAIEEGRFQDLPGSTYAVGFVRGYADYLGLDGAEMVRRFKQENSDLSGRAELVFPSATSGGGIPTGALLVLALVGAGIAYGAWVWLQDRNEPAAEAVPPLPERLAALIHKPVDALADTPAATTQAIQQTPAEQTAAAVSTPAPTVAANTQPPTEAAPPPAAEAPPPAAQQQPQQQEAAPPSEPAKPVKTAKAKKTETPAPAPAPAAAPAPAPEGDKPAAATTAAADAPAPAPAAETPKQDKPAKPTWIPSKHLKIAASGDCWIKIVDSDGKMLWSRLMKAGDTLTPPGNPGMTMIVGNAGAITLTLDGKEQPSLGAMGAVKKIPLDGSDKADAPAQ